MVLERSEAKHAATDFICYGGPFERYRDRLGDRFYSFKIALNVCLQRRCRTIVETGSMRGPVDGWLGDGNSTLLFGEFLDRYGGHLWTCDLNPKATDRARFVTRQYSSHITYVTGDSIEFLTGFDRPIDLLYLDSYDTPREGNALAPQRHNLRELKTALPRVSPGGVILLDDNWYPNGGKTRLSKRYLLGQGWLCLLDSQQSLWIRR